MREYPSTSTRCVGPSCACNVSRSESQQRGREGECERASDRERERDRKEERESMLCVCMYVLGGGGEAGRKPNMMRAGVCFIYIQISHAVGWRLFGPGPGLAGFPGPAPGSAAAIEETGQILF